jgi:protease-4
MRKYRGLAIGVVAGVLLLWFLTQGREPTIPSNSTLVINLSGHYVESADPPLLMRLLPDTHITFAALLSELKKAERDDRISTVIFRLRSLDIGWAQAQELRTAIQQLSAAGRHTIAYLELAGLSANIEYYVASAADEVRSSPAASTGLVGLAAEYLFLGQMWNKFGIDFDVARAGKYKSAVETITGEEMSDSYREVANAILDSINAQFISGIAKSRGLTPEVVQFAIDRAPMTPEALAELSLIDKIEFFDEMIDSMEGPIVDGAEYAQIDPASVGWNPVARFALIYGSGNVVVGRGTNNSRGTPVLASDSVAEALEDAAEDSDIQAIIFRIDSPGGSVLASDIVWRALEIAKRSGKPVIASFSNVAASGGYYIAAGADVILAPPASLTGSIGVFALRPVFAGLFDKLDIRVERMTRGAHADLLLSSTRLSPGTAALLRDEVDAIYELFVERVASGRNLDRAAIEAVAQGRVWTGEQALEHGLIDGLGGLREAVAHAKQALGLDPDVDVALAPYPPPGSLADQLSETLRRIALRAVPSLSLPGLAGQIQDRLATVPVGVPALVPPFVLDIR